MEDKIEDTIETNDTKYIIIDKKGSGGTSNAFLVTEKNNNSKYIIKILKIETKVNLTYYANEVRCMNILKQENNPYILDIIDSGECKVIRKDRNNGLPLIKKYIVLEHAPNRELADFIIYAQKGLGEDKSKALFYKIIKGVESMHKKGICHRDIKLENILLDDKFNPKIADFGNAIENANNLNTFFGTLPYAAPEVVDNIPYDGCKADIFSLGVTLMNLSFNYPGLTEASQSCGLYKNIISNQIEKYFLLLNEFIKDDISKEFKELFIWMVAYHPENRPSIQEILSHNWFKSYLEMNDDQKKNLDKEVIKEFENRVKIIDHSIKDEIKKANKESEQINTKSSGSKQRHFNDNMKPIKANNGFDTSFSIKINGWIYPSRFMDYVFNKISKEFDGKCVLEANKNKLKFTVVFKEEDEEEKLNGNIKGNNVIIKFKLYEADEGLLLKLFKVEGSAKNFFDKFLEISDMLKSS